MNRHCVIGSIAAVSALTLAAVLHGNLSAAEGELGVAQKLSSETGRPLLVVAGNDT